MKSIKTIIGVALLMLGAIGFASCSQDDDVVIQEKGNLLKIRTSVADSRGVITGTTFQQGDEIGICVTTLRWTDTIIQAIVRIYVLHTPDQTGDWNGMWSCVRMRRLYMLTIHTMPM